tara:strand:+ start:570 stop:1175 length:606 start_codon:yes stop_codon:yes gene_type:complete
MKRLFDLFCVVISIPFWLPILVLISLIILIFQGRPIFFKQSRLGYKGREIKIIKFCTMNSLKNKRGELLSDSKRTTKLGKLLRRYSVDELPSIFNVFMNQMSFVGPRPFISDYKDLYNDYQMRRHNVMPGITGWAQVNGRNAISWEEKFELDIWYVENHSFWLDIKILLKTLWKVVKREGIAYKQFDTMPRFTGNKIGEDK